MSTISKTTTPQPNTSSTSDKLQSDGCCRVHVVGGQCRRRERGGGGSDWEEEIGHFLIVLGGSVKRRSVVIAMVIT